MHFLYRCLPVTLLGLLSTSTHLSATPQTDYAVIVSQQTLDQPEWKQVTDALVAKHRAQVIPFDDSVTDSLPALQDLFPRHVCFVATPAEVTRSFVAQVHQLTRQLDQDPYTDCLWGILTGYDAKNALQIARHHQPLTVRRVASGTEVSLEMCEEGVWYCELVQNKMVRKPAGGSATESQGPSDTTVALAECLTQYHADLFVTSGHATERDWQIGFRYRNGQFVSKAGKLYGQDTRGQRFSIESSNPKVYLPIGNCLMGHIDGQDAMALAWLNSVGVHQMIGYTVPTWYGYGGWGMLDYFVEQPGRFTMSEAFFASHQALLHRLQTYFPDIAQQSITPGETDRSRVKLSARARQDRLTATDAQGLLFDRDVVAFYGDPAWQARMAKRPTAWQQRLTQEGDVYTLSIKPQRGDQSFQPINTNGAQRGWRPIVQLLPHRVEQIEILSGDEWEPLITDNFILIPLPKSETVQPEYQVRFRAQRIHR